MKRMSDGQQKISANMAKAMEAADALPEGGFISLADVKKPNQVIAPQNLGPGQTPQSIYQSAAPKTVAIEQAQQAVDSALKAGYQEGVVRGAAYAAIAIGGLYGVGWLISSLWSWSKAASSVAK